MESVPDNGKYNDSSQFTIRYILKLIILLSLVTTDFYQSMMIKYKLLDTIEEILKSLNILRRKKKKLLSAHLCFELIVNDSSLISSIYFSRLLIYRNDRY